MEDALETHDPAAFSGLEGHGKPCFYCGESCDGLAGNPGLWPIPFPHKDAPGVVKWHHMQCVYRRVNENERLQHLIKEKDEALEKAEQCARLAVFSATNNALDEDEQGRAIYDHAAKIAGMIADEIADLRRAREAKDRK